MNQSKKEELRQLWLARIRDLYDSGLTQQEWCNKNKMPISTLRYWLRRLKKQMEKEAPNNWLRVDSGQFEVANLQMLEKEEPPQSGISIKYGEFTVCLPVAFEPQRAFEVLRILKSL